MRLALKYLVIFNFFLSALLRGLVTYLFDEVELKVEVEVLVILPWSSGLCRTH